MSASKHDPQCPECRGEGRGREEIWNWNGDTIGYRHWECDHCDGTGIDQDADEPEPVHPYIALIGKAFALVWATNESAPYERDASVKPSHDWHQVHDACRAVYGLDAKAYGVKH